MQVQIFLFFFFSRKDEVREARMEKQRVKEGPHRTAHKQNNPKHTQEALPIARHGSVTCRYENKKNKKQRNSQRCLRAKRQKSGVNKSCKTLLDLCLKVARRVKQSVE